MEKGGNSEIVAFFKGQFSELSKKLEEVQKELIEIKIQNAQSNWTELKAKFDLLAQWLNPAYFTNLDREREIFKDALSEKKGGNVLLTSVKTVVELIIAGAAIYGLFIKK